MHFKKYCENLEMAIEELVLKEAKNGISEKNEQILHFLLENRKHIKQYKAEKAAQEKATSAVPVVKT